MARYVLRRLTALVPVLLVVGVVVFALVHLTPGDPAAVILGDNATTDQVQQLHHELGLDAPLYLQFARWLGNACRFRFGQSLFLNRPVTQALLDRAQPTGLLTLYAFGIAVLIGVPAGIIAALRRNSALDRVLMTLAISGVAIPSFVLGILLILLFAVLLHWLPAGGYIPFSKNPGAHFKTMVMPAFSLGFASSALLARIVRSSMLDVLREDYVRTAYAKGLRTQAVVLRHALRNALIPIITVVGISLGGILGGAVVTETVFNLPGMGQLVVQSVLRRDFPVIQGAVMVTATIYLLVNLVVDVLYVYLDPRIRYGSD